MGGRERRPGVTMGILRTLKPPPRGGAPAGEGEAPEPVSEAQLVARAREGELDAWTHLYHSHFERVYQFVGNLTGDPCLAEDLTQE
ncbi:MAG: hypothetical protein KC468_24315, partial [Myxococcales bacterium]|nr:hypothetical protein [Myxococcales bacterium]